MTLLPVWNVFPLSLKHLFFWGLNQMLSVIFSSSHFWCSFICYVFQGVYCMLVYTVITIYLLASTMNSLGIYPNCKVLITTSYSFVDTLLQLHGPRRHETPGSETNGLNTDGIADNMDFMFCWFFLFLKSSGINKEKPSWILCTLGLCVTVEKPQM